MDVYYGLLKAGFRRANQWLLSEEKNIDCSTDILWFAARRTCDLSTALYSGL